MIVHTFDATGIFPDIAIVDGADSDSTVPLESTPIAPKACSTPTRRCEIDTHVSTINGMRNDSFVVSDVSVPALNGDCDTFMYRDPFVLPSAVTISPVQRLISKISVTRTSCPGTFERFGILFSFTAPFIGNPYTSETARNFPSLSLYPIERLQLSSTAEMSLFGYGTGIAIGG